MNIFNELNLKSKTIKQKYRELLLSKHEIFENKKIYHDLQLLCDEYNTFIQQYKHRISKEYQDTEIEIIEHSIYCFYNDETKVRSRGGGLMALLSMGAQDVFLTRNNFR